MLSTDILIKGSKQNTLSGPCIVEGWEGNHIRVLFPSGYRPLLRPNKLIQGTVLDYHPMPSNVKQQLEEDGTLRLIAYFYDGSVCAFHNLQEVADHVGQHRASAQRVYQCMGYSSTIISIKDILN